MGGTYLEACFLGTPVPPVSASFGTGFILGPKKLHEFIPVSPPIWSKSELNTRFQPYLLISKSIFIPGDFVCQTSQPSEFSSISPSGSSYLGGPWVAPAFFQEQHHALLDLRRASQLNRQNLGAFLLSSTKESHWELLNDLGEHGTGVFLGNES